MVLMTGLKLPTRPRRLRQSESIRQLIKETHLNLTDFVAPIFVSDRSHDEEISSMPGILRFQYSSALSKVSEFEKLGIKAIAPFPCIADKFKDKYATFAKNPDNIYLKFISEVREKFPSITIFSDIAMDPYSSDGHDGVLKNGKILNDESVEILCEMAIAQAKAGSHFVSPSDMMDGRVGAIRQTLDQLSYTDTGIMAYSSKFASAFYGPFREALDSEPRSGDKKTYQMNPANRFEAFSEAQLDIEEGADILMVKPAMNYLDVIRDLKNEFSQPIAAYQVSGEFSMLKNGAASGLFDERTAFEESLTAIKRSGADLILSYYSEEFARQL